jgi:signal transduction histidine kinase
MSAREEEKMPFDRTTRAAPRWPGYALAFGVFTVLGLLDAAESFVRYAYRSQPSRGWETVAMGLALWYTWGLLAYFVYQLSRHYSIDQRNWLRCVPLYAAVGVAVVLVKLAIDYPIIKAFYCRDPNVNFLVFYPLAFTDQFFRYVLIYSAMVGVFHALKFHHQYRERELRAAHLETRLAQAQLQLLRMQLHPHFLFNTLNAISALIHRDTEMADRMVARLGDLLRLTLEHQGVHEVTLQQELEFIEAYLEIEQVRFGSRLAVRMNVDPDALGARVPYLVLQPLVENALRHGLSPLGRAGCVAIRARPSGQMLQLQVEDSGPGLVKRPGGRSRGIGLSNTRARLDRLYGSEHRFDLGQGELGGLLVTIEIPFDGDPVSAPGSSFGLPWPSEGSGSLAGGYREAAS